MKRPTPPKRLIPLALILLALVPSLFSCINYLPRGEESDSTAESTTVAAPETGEVTDETESGTSETDSGIPNETEDNYTKFY